MRLDKFWKIQLNKMTKYAVLFLLLFVTSITFAQDKQAIVEGFVKDKISNHSIPLVQFIIDGEVVGSTSEKGFFNFKVSIGITKIKLSRIGYKSLGYQLKIDSTETEEKLTFYLNPNPIGIEKVTIRGERYREKLIYKTYELQQGDLRNIPAFVESDALRAIQALPGVTTISDFTTQIYLRGGNYDETMLSLDGVPLYNPYHVGGLFGTFNPDIIRMEKLYPSNYPVNYGGYISGILDIQSKDGDNQIYNGSASVGLLSSKIYVEGPIGSGTAVFSGRRTYLDALGFINKNLKFPYYFYDLYGKYTLPLGENNLFKISTLYTKDDFELYSGSLSNSAKVNKNEDANWGNILLKGEYFHFLKHSSFNLDFYYTRFRLGADAEVNYPSDYYNNSKPEFLFVDNRISEYSASVEYHYENDGHNIKTGLRFRKINTSYNWNIGRNEFDQYIYNGTLENIFYDFAENPFSSNDETENIAFYAMDEIQINKKFSTQGGLRFSYLTNSKMFLSSPFLSAKYNVVDNIILSISYGKYYQYFYTKRESVDNSPVVPFSIYYISNNRENLPASDHFSLAFTWNNLPHDFSLDIEFYYKNRKNIPSAFENEKLIKYLDGYAGGIDILLRKVSGPITGWINYSYSRSIKKDNGNYFFSNYDRTHNVKIVANFSISEKWTLNLFWTYASGLPFTPLKGKYLRSDFNQNSNYNLENELKWQLVNGYKNSARFTAYSRLDIGITGNYILGKRLFKPYFQILNVYDSNNPFHYTPNVRQSSYDEGADIGSFIIPTFGITMEF